MLHNTAFLFSAVPYFTIEPEIKNVAEDETVEIQCAASGVPEPQIKWIHNGKPISEAPPNERRIVGPNSIMIKRLVKADTGNYGCNATNSLGYVYKDVYINVLGNGFYIIKSCLCRSNSKLKLISICNIMKINNS